MATVRGKSIFGVYRNVKNDQGVIINDSLICIGTAQECANVLGFADISTIYRLAKKTVVGLEVVRLFVECE